MNRQHVFVLMLGALILISCGDPAVLRFQSSGSLALKITQPQSATDENLWPIQFDVNLILTGSGIQMIEKVITIHVSAQDSNIYQSVEPVEAPLGDTLTIALSAILEGVNWQGQTTVFLESGVSQVATVELVAGNQPPWIPSNPNPPNGNVSVDTAQVMLTWEGGDPDPVDTITYRVDWGIFPNLDNSSPWLPFNEYFLNSLTFGVQYNWQVTARDNHNHEVVGPVWQFVTMPVAPPNHPPNVPANPSPQNGAIDVPWQSVLLQWAGGDPDSLDVLTYRLHWGLTSTAEDSSQLLALPYYYLLNLIADTSYYWGITAKDSQGDSMVGQVWSFRTAAQGIVNNPPSTPSSPAPQNGAVDVDTLQILMSWNCFDPDQGDSLTYKIEWGTSPSLGNVIPNLTSFLYLMPSLASGTLHYWRVTGTDNHQASSIGPVWQFTTIAPDTAVIINFPDIGLEAAVRSYINKPTGPIYSSDVDTITDFNASELGIFNLNGMEFMTSLQRLDLQYNNLSTFQPIANLTSLLELRLNGNSISNIAPLSTLINLTLLALDNNQIVDVSPCSTLVNLQTLGLNGNLVSDVYPLVVNQGMGTGDVLWLQFNPLSTQSINVFIPNLQTRGVTVYWQ